MRSIPNTIVLETGENLGFAEGNNVGIRYALERGADFVLLLNNDTIVHPGILQSFVDGARCRPDGGVFGAKIYYHAEPSKIWYAGGAWAPKSMCFMQVGDGDTDHGQFEDIVTTEFVIGCAMFIPSPVLRQIGLLEPMYFLNYEEIDFCTRVTRSGFANVFVPTAKLWHKISVSFGGEDSPLKTYFTFRNRLLWAKRNLPFRQRVAIHWSIYAQVNARFFGHLLRTEGGDRRTLRGLLWRAASALKSANNRAWWLGIRDYWRCRFGTCPPEVWELQRNWKTLRKI